MKPRSPGAARIQNGIAAIELALLLPLLLLLFTIPLYLGRVLWHYTVMQRAAQDAGRYVATIPLNEMTNPAQVASMIAVANDIVDAELAELSPGPQPILKLVTCDFGMPCGGYSVPATIQVAIQLQVDDPFFSEMTGLSIPLNVRFVSPYFGN